MTSICCFMVWTGPEELLRLAVSNHRWAMKDFPHHMVIRCSEKSKAKAPSLENVSYSAQGPDGWIEAWRSYLDDEIIRSHDIVIVNQLDQLWNKPVNHLVEFALSGGIATGRAGHYWTLVLPDGGRLSRIGARIWARLGRLCGYDASPPATRYPRIWDGGLVASSSVVQSWQSDGITLDYSSEALQDCRNDHPALYDALCRLSDPSGGKFHRYVGGGVVSTTARRDIGYAVQLWCAWRRLPVRVHSDTTHFQGIETYMRMGRHRDAALSEFDPITCLSALTGSLRHRTYLGHWPLVLAGITLAGWEASRDELQHITHEYREFVRLRDERSLTTVASQVSEWCEDAEALARLDRYVSNIRSLLFDTRGRTDRVLLMILAGQGTPAPKAPAWSSWKRTGYDMIGIEVHGRVNWPEDIRTVSMNDGADNPREKPRGLSPCADWVRAVEVGLSFKDYTHFLIVELDTHVTRQAAEPLSGFLRVDAVRGPALKSPWMMDRATARRLADGGQRLLQQQDNVDCELDDFIRLACEKAGVRYRHPPSPGEAAQESRRGN